MTMSRRIFLTIRRVSHRSCRQNQNTNFVLNDEKCREAIQAADYNIAACWFSKATRPLSRLNHAHTRTHPPARTHAHTHTEICRIILIAFPLQQWFRERSSVLRCTYIACLINNNNRELCLTNFYWYLCVYLCCA